MLDLDSLDYLLPVPPVGLRAIPLASPQLVLQQATLILVEGDFTTIVVTADGIPVTADGEIVTILVLQAIGEVHPVPLTIPGGPDLPLVSFHQPVAELTVLDIRMPIRPVIDMPMPVKAA